MPSPRPEHIPTRRAMLPASIGKEALSRRAVPLSRQPREAVHLCNTPARIPQLHHNTFLRCRAASLPHSPRPQASRRRLQQ